MIYVQLLVLAALGLSVAGLGIGLSWPSAFADTTSGEDGA